MKKDDELIGPSPYIDSPELYNRIIQEKIEFDNNDISDDSDKEMCCQRSSLNIANPKLITDININANTVKYDALYESSIYGDFEPYNNPYYDYMETEKKIYDSLYGNMRKMRNPGSLNP